MIKLTDLITEVSYQFKGKKPSTNDFIKLALRYLYTQDETGRWIVTEKTITDYLTATAQPSMKHISDSVVKSFDLYSINQFATTKKGSNVKNDVDDISEYWNDTLKRR